MKKLISTLLSVIMCIACALTFCACDQTPPTDPPPADPPSGTMTNAEKSAAYKEVAVATWESLGVEDPTTTTSPVLTTLPDKKVEIDITDTSSGEALNIKLNAVSIPGFLYMLGLLYENPAFTLTNDIAKFNVTVTAGPGTTDQNLTLTSTIDTQTGKVELELIVDIPTQNSVQYSYVEVNYNFATDTLNSFRFALINESATAPFPFIIDMALTEDDKFMWYNTMDTTDSFAVALTEKKDAFIASAQSVTALTADFSSEVQDYFDIVNGIVADLQPSSN